MRIQILKPEFNSADVTANVVRFKFFHVHLKGPSHEILLTCSRLVVSDVSVKFAQSASKWEPRADT
jgi:hypothetical protein